MSARFIPSKLDVNAQARSQKPMRAARPAFILALATLVLAIAACEPGAPAPENGAVPAPVTADAPAAPSVATTIEPAGTSAPTIISVTAELNGPVFVDGVRVALATPLEAHRVVTGRHEVQVVGPGAAWLSQPTLMLAREGVHSRVHLRNQAQRTALNLQEVAWEGSGELGPMNTMAGVPQFPPGVDWTTGIPNAMLPTPVEGSAPPEIATVNLPRDPAPFVQNWQPTALQGGGTPEGSTYSATEASADNSLPNNAAEASGNPAPIQATPGEASTAAPDVEGSVAPTAPNSPPAALPADLPMLHVWLVDPRQPANPDRTRLFITSRPGGVVYVNNVSTGRMTPVLMDVEPGEISLQVLYENGDLSKSLPVNSNAGQGRAVYFIGPLDFALR